jgi:hypothetical protein
LLEQRPAYQQVEGDLGALDAGAPRHCARRSRGGAGRRRHRQRLVRALCHP